MSHQVDKNPLTDDPRHIGELDRVRGITAKEFFHEYYAKRKPVVLEGLMDDWPALGLWNLEHFQSVYGSELVRVGRCFGETQTMKLGDYIQNMHELDPESRSAGRPPLYMEGWYYRESRPELANDYIVPSFFGPDWIEAKWFPFNPRPLFHGILIGPKGSFTKLHYDQLATHSWNAQLLGRKQWILVSPDQMKNAYMDTRQDPGHHQGTDVDAPDLERYPLLGKLRYQTATVNPGEMIWFPSLWMHQVLSLDDTISVTHNYLGANNVPRFLGHLFATRFLGKKGI